MKALLKILPCCFLFLQSNFVLAKEATQTTAEVNAAVLQELPFGNTADFEDAARGFIAPLPNRGIIKNDQGNVVWDLSLYEFLKDDKKKSPDTVNASLWRQGMLLDKAGLFKVVDGIYQIRGADLSNMTIIEGKDGITIIDPLLTKETAKAALALYYNNRPKKPIKAVIYTHSHADHFGGVKGVISQEDVDKGKVRVIAPSGFTEAALDENVMAGNVMARRASYMYGSLIKPGPEGQMTAGLGLSTSSGETTLILPTELVEKTGEKKEIDGVQYIFLYAPHSEAPAEMLFYLPKFKALSIAEDASHTMHNIYTLRGAKVRDARVWAKYLNQAIEMFGKDAKVVFGQHLWPVWENRQVNDYLEKQRDLYKYMHDQVLRLANQGYTMVEIGEMIKLPEGLANEWYNRGYYGSLNHNAKAIYNFYLGWFDGNPSTLHPLPPAEASEKYVEYMGGADAILEKAEEDYANGNYRWVAEALNHIVYTDPQNKVAKDLLADTLEQLGFQAENAVWRNFYLTGAQELRKGIQKLSTPIVASPDVIAAMPTEKLLDYLAIQLNGLKAAEDPVTLNVNFIDTNEKYVVQTKNGVLNYFPKKTMLGADATLKINRLDFNEIALGKTTLKDLIKSGKVTIEGNADAVYKFISQLDKFNFWFNIVELNQN